MPDDEIYNDNEEETILSPEEWAELHWRMWNPNTVIPPIEENDE